MTVSREVAWYKLDLVGVQEVKWEGGVTEHKKTNKHALSLSLSLH
jgi:hypothetical protein